MKIPDTIKFIRMSNHSGTKNALDTYWLPKDVCQNLYDYQINLANFFCVFGVLGFWGAAAAFGCVLEW